MFLCCCLCFLEFTFQVHKWSLRWRGENTSYLLMCHLQKGTSLDRAFYLLQGTLCSPSSLFSLLFSLTLRPWLRGLSCSSVSPGIDWSSLSCLFWWFLWFLASFCSLPHFLTNKRFQICAVCEFELCRLSDFLIEQYDCFCAKHYVFINVWSS